MKTRNLAIMALYAVTLGMAASCFVLNILGTISVDALVRLLAIGMFSLDAAGIRSIAERSKEL